MAVPRYNNGLHSMRARITKTTFQQWVVSISNMCVWILSSPPGRRALSSFSQHSFVKLRLAPIQHKIFYPNKDVTGTWSIFPSGGYIVTRFHVIGRNDSQYKVQFVEEKRVFGGTHLLNWKTHSCWAQITILFRQTEKFAAVCCYSVHSVVCVFLGRRKINLARNITKRPKNTFQTNFFFIDLFICYF